MKSSGRGEEWGTEGGGGEGEVAGEGGGGERERRRGRGEAGMAECRLERLGNN